MKNNERPFLVYYTYRAEIWFALQAAIATIVFFALKAAAHSHGRMEQFPVFGFLLMAAYLFFFLDLISHFRREWPYTIWTKNRRTYITFDANKVSIFGDFQIAWSDISDVKAVEVMSRIKAPAVTYLILVLIKERKADATAFHGAEKLRSNNAWIVKNTAGTNFNLQANDFLSVEIAAPLSGSLASHLSAGSDQIVDAAKMYFREKECK